MLLKRLWILPKLFKSPHSLVTSKRCYHRRPGILGYSQRLDGSFRFRVATIDCEDVGVCPHGWLNALFYSDYQQLSMISYLDMLYSIISI